MQSDKQPVSHNYLRNILTDGARPFLYRCGIRSLLGIPDNSNVNSLSTSLSMPPGFTYRDYAFGADESCAPYKITEEINPALSNERAAESGEATDRFQKRIHASATFKKNNFNGPLYPDTSSMNSGVNNGSQSIGFKKNEILKSNDALKAAREMAFVKADEKAGKVDALLERAHMDIPGFSEKRQSFPGINPVQGRPMPSEKNMKEWPDHSKKTVFGEEDQEKMALQRPDFSLVEKKLQKEEAFKEIRTNKEGTKVTGNRNEESPIAIQNIAGKAVRQNSERQMVNLSAEVKEETKDLSAKIRPRLSQHSGMNTLIGSNRYSADKIDQLRHAVHELTYKVSSRNAKADKEKKAYEAESAPPHQPAKQVVIYTQPSGKSRMPRAFWERSYVGHFHRMNLR